MQRNIDENAQKKRKKDAVISAIWATAWMLLTGVGMLVLRHVFRVDGFGGAVLVILSVLDLGAIVPVWILLNTRLREIEGGEEDAAAQY